MPEQFLKNAHLSRLSARKMALLIFTAQILVTMKPQNEGPYARFSDTDKSVLVYEILAR